VSCGRGAKSAVYDCLDDCVCCRCGRVWRHPGPVCLRRQVRQHSRLVQLSVWSRTTQKPADQRLRRSVGHLTSLSVNITLRNLRRPLTTYTVDVLATCMPKPTRIVVNCDPEFYSVENHSGIWDMGKWGVLHFGSIRRRACLAISACAELLVIPCNSNCCGQRWPWTLLNLLLNEKSNWFMIVEYSKPKQWRFPDTVWLKRPDFWGLCFTG